MLKILIVENEPMLAVTLRELIELNPRHRVTAICSDLASALAAVETTKPDLALVDIHLARGSSGYMVAVKLNELGVQCLFATANVPPFPMPELALGCLSKPFEEEDLARALKAAEDKLRGREPVRPSLPSNLRMYELEPQPVAPESFIIKSGRARSRSLWSRWSGPSGAV